MQVGSALQMFIVKGLWEVTRAPYFGRLMVRGLASPDRNVRTIAGILLVRGGAKAEPILLEALRDHNNPEMVLRVLGDVASTRAKPSILPFAEDSDPKIADAAKDALKIIDLRAQYQAGLKSTPGKPSYQQ